MKVLCFSTSGGRKMEFFFLGLAIGMASILTWNRLVATTTKATANNSSFDDIYVMLQHHGGRNDDSSKQQEQQQAIQKEKVYSNTRQQNLGFPNDTTKTQQDLPNTNNDEGINNLSSLNSNTIQQEQNIQANQIKLPPQPAKLDNNVTLAFNNSSALQETYSHLYPTEVTSLPLVLVLYFPQYHQDPLNDFLWGKGFTDWDSLRAAPTHNRKGGQIPRPLWGYYDLTNVTIRQQQARLAKQFGVDGFVYHHYWFYDDDNNNGGPTLGRTMELMLKDGEPDIPFCFNWAATSWISTWNRQTNFSITTKILDKNMTGDLSLTDAEKRVNATILQAQYFPTDKDKIQKHYNWLRQFFHHKNYIKVDGGRPVFMLYRFHEGLVPILHQLQTMAKADGFSRGIYVTLGRYSPHPDLFPQQLRQSANFTPLYEGEYGGVFDANSYYPNPVKYMRRETFRVPEWCLRHTRPPLLKHITVPNDDDNATTRLEKNDVYHALIGFITSFDNTPRRSFDEARVDSVWVSDTMRKYRKNLRAALYYQVCCLEQQQETMEEKTPYMILINAWNEWAEGMAMEPSDVYKHLFLKTLTRMKQEVRRVGCHSFVKDEVK